MNKVNAFKHKNLCLITSCKMHEKEYLRWRSRPKFSDNN